MPDLGIQILNWDKQYQSSWGQWRARLEPMKGTIVKNRNNFYLHDSYQGESSGCIECETELYYNLVDYREEGNDVIEVQVDYPNNSKASTNGNTEMNPRPWRIGVYKDPGDKSEWPYPRDNSFPIMSRIPTSLGGTKVGGTKKEQKSGKTPGVYVSPKASDTGSAGGKSDDNAWGK